MGLFLFQGTILNFRGVEAKVQDVGMSASLEQHGTIRPASLSLSLGSKTPKGPIAAARGNTLDLHVEQQQ